MSIFGDILNKIMGHASSDAPTNSQPASSSTAEPAAAGSAAPATAAQASGTPVSAAQTVPVDVEAVLTDMASKAGGGGNWQTSIVDLLKLLGLDASLSARSELGKELGVHVGVDGSAEQNIALHKAVMQKVADNGGIVPASMRG